MQEVPMTASLGTVPRPLADVRVILDQLLQVSVQWPTSNGLVIEGRPAVAKAGLAVNLSFQAIDQAVRRGCDLLVSHHAALPSTDAHLVDEKLGRLRRAGLSLYVCHESLDCAREFGTADALARAVQVALQGPFKPDGVLECAVHGVTLGRFTEFVTRVGNRLGIDARAWKNGDSFGHVAVIPGWGGRPEWMRRAQELGCDTVLTGEALLFGLLFAREAGLNLVLAGHYASETPGMLALAARIARDLKVEVTFIPEEIVEAVA
jgi:putative NIF3 family GTP cyclohydrolase 1 type 2